MKSPTISIIVPVYNTERFLPQCIESVLSQSFCDFELLLIDDGSTDESGAICDAYSQRDSRIKVFHQDNGGVSSARNVGLDNIKGEWIFFMDSDDFLPAKALDMLMSCTDSEVDMIYGGIRKFNGIDDNLETILVGCEGGISIEDALDAFVFSAKRVGDWHRYLFNRCFRTSIINKHNLRFHTDIYYKEDGLFVVQYLCRCNHKIVCLSDIVYLYRQTDNSSMGRLKTAYNAKLLTNVDSHGLILRELKKFGVSKDLIEREKRHIIQNYFWIASVMKRSGDLSRKTEYLLFKRIVKNAGIRVSFHYLFFPRLCRIIKRSLS